MFSVSDLPGTVGSSRQVSSLERTGGHLCVFRSQITGATVVLLSIVSLIKKVFCSQCCVNVIQVCFLSLVCSVCKILNLKDGLRRSSLDLQAAAHIELSNQVVGSVPGSNQVPVCNLKESSLSV
ncbi:hypothetical protein ILYODFUR_019942 [Ilyodon furcidens]|uniref:Uncharacterized protein n=1 Tax=Ilyodon furcidens TaxID=33524 RepID=A0ABV0VFH3_9TELE